MKLIAHSLALLCCIIAADLLAQIAPNTFDHIAGQQYGIPHMDIRQIMQSRDGFFWIATQKGLIRYDGNDMILYRENPGNSNGLSDNRIDHVVEDRFPNLPKGKYYLVIRHRNHLGMMSVVAVDL